MPIPTWGQIIASTTDANYGGALANYLLPAVIFVMVVIIITGLIGFALRHLSHAMHN